VQKDKNDQKSDQKDDTKDQYEPKKSKMTRVGFEPTHISVVEIEAELKSTALDHSAIVSRWRNRQEIKISMIISLIRKAMPVRRRVDAMMATQNYGGTYKDTR
jgi:outer membrane scaffolding protein for murein synthesis (MipA/OmpV family)